MSKSVKEMPFIPLTFLAAVVKMVKDGGENGGQIHAVCALGQAESEQFTPAEAHQLCLDVLTTTNKHQPHSYNHVMGHFCETMTLCHYVSFVIRQLFFTLYKWTLMCELVVSINKSHLSSTILALSLRQR